MKTITSLIIGGSPDDTNIDEDLDSTGAVMEEGEEFCETMFQSVIGSCSEEEIVVRLEKDSVFSSSSFI